MLSPLVGQPCRVWALIRMIVVTPIEASTGSTGMRAWVLLPDRCNGITSSAPFHHLQGKPIYLPHTHGDAHVYMHGLQLPPTGAAELTCYRHTLAWRIEVCPSASDAAGWQQP